MKFTKKRIIITISVLCIVVAVALFCKSGPRTIKTSPYPEITLERNANFVFPSGNIKIEELALVALPKKGPLFVIKVINNELTEEAQQEKFARRLASFAYRNKVTDIAYRVKLNGKPPLLYEAIGVAICQRSGTDALNHIKGRRFQFSYSDLSGNATSN